MFFKLEKEVKLELVVEKDNQVREGQEHIFIHFNRYFERYCVNYINHDRCDHLVLGNVYIGQLDCLHYRLVHTVELVAKLENLSYRVPTNWNIQATFM